MRLDLMFRASAAAGLAVLLVFLGVAGAASSGGGGAVTVRVSRVKVAPGRSFKIIASGTLPAGTQSIFNSLYFGVNSPATPCAASYSADKFEFPPIEENPTSASFKYGERYDALFVKPGRHDVCAYLSFQGPGASAVDLVAQARVRITRG